MGKNTKNCGSEKKLGICGKKLNCRARAIFVTAKEKRQGKRVVNTHINPGIRVAIFPVFFKQFIACPEKQKP